MKGFQTKYYEIQSEKIKEYTEIKIAFLSDQHGLEFGEGNCDLFDEIVRENPDIILIAGDMVVRSDLRTFSKAEK